MSNYHYNTIYMDTGPSIALLDIFDDFQFVNRRATNMRFTLIDIYQIHSYFIMGNLIVSPNL